MGADKGGAKSKGLFHLFDWNKKSRKKLFSISPESTKEKRMGDRVPGTILGLLDEEIAGISSIKSSNDYSCSSSIADEEGNGIKTLGVVARLMGLNSMPAPEFSSPCLTPLPDQVSHGDKQNHKGSPEFFINDQFSHARNRAEVYTRKTTDFRIQKMPSSPIQRFQTETFPSRSVKTVSLTQHKLLSPIKAPGFVSHRNAAHIMEEAAKILEPVLHVRSRTKASSQYGPLKINEPKNSIAGSHRRTSGSLDMARKPVESNDIRFLKMHSLNKSWTDSEKSSSTFRPSPEISDSNSLDDKGKGKSVSLAIQAKVNVQKREGLPINSKNKSSVLQDVDESKLNQPLKRHTTSQKNKQVKKVLPSRRSSVLTQNNQKQNCLSNKGKVTSKQFGSNKQGRKNLCRENSSRLKNTTNRSDNSIVVNRKDNLEACSTEFEVYSTNKDFPQKKRLIEGNFNSQRVFSTDNIQVMCHQNRVQSNIVIDEQSRWSEEKINDGSGIVSFTLNAPLVKSTHGLLSSVSLKENCEKMSSYKFERSFQRNSLSAKNPSPMDLNITTDDTLSLLLEQKLRELTSGDESSYCKFGEATSPKTYEPIQQVQEFDVASLSSNTTAHKNEFITKTCGQQSPAFAAGLSCTNAHVFGLTYKLQGLERECSSSSDARNEPNLLQLTPLSILETSFSADSCKLSASTKGSKRSLQSTQTQNINSSTENNLSSFDTGLNLLNSGCSSFSSGRTLVPSKIQRNNSNLNREDLEYIREILNCRRVGAVDLVLRSMNSLLFNKLEKKRSNEDNRTRRKLTFDCVKECLDNRYNRFFSLGFQGWVNGETRRPKDLAKETYEEILRWKGYGDFMVDELVDRDMSSHRGRWVDFEMEAFELGEEIENEIINSFIDEVITHCFYVQV